MSSVVMDQCVKDRGPLVLDANTKFRPRQCALRHTCCWLHPSAILTYPSTLTSLCDRTSPPTVGSFFDYGCSILANVSDNLIDRLQSVLSAAARVVFSARRSAHISQLLCDLHWWWVLQRCVLAYRYLKGTVGAVASSWPQWSTYEVAATSTILETISLGRLCRHLTGVEQSGSTRSDCVLTVLLMSTFVDRSSFSNLRLSCLY